MIRKYIQSCMNNWLYLLISMETSETDKVQRGTFFLSGGCVAIEWGYGQFFLNNRGVIFSIMPSCSTHVIYTL